jgi:aminoglycoside N3'-acetyltransferase
MSFLAELQSSMAALVGEDDRPIVVYGALWPIMREMRRNDSAVVDEILEAVIQVAAGRDLLMPSFAEGYRNGVCNLDEAPASTGVLSEHFRRRPDSLRTLSAYFSFNVLGSAKAELGRLMPWDAWGEGSVYDWMEQRNARFLMLGTHPTHCSYVHRLEWLVREQLPYRYRKPFNGTLIRGLESIPCEETLYVRSLAPPAKNDFTGLLPVLREAGMLEQPLRGISLAAYDACTAHDAILPLLQRDPLLVLSNRGDFEKEPS